jgi:hypothetical protein
MRESAPSQSEPRPIPQSRKQVPARLTRGDGPRTLNKSPLRAETSSYCFEL